MPAPHPEGLERALSDEGRHMLRRALLVPAAPTRRPRGGRRRKSKSRSPNKGEQSPQQRGGGRERGSRAQREQREQEEERERARRAQEAEAAREVRRFVEHYLGRANWPVDRVLQMAADEHGEGWVPLAALAEFPAVRQLLAGVDGSLAPLRMAVAASDAVEVSANGALVRPARRAELRRIVARASGPFRVDAQPLHSLASVGGGFSVLSYNVLAQNLATTRMFPYAADEVRDWRTRAAAIRQEILFHAPDVLMLQELQFGRDLRGRERGRRHSDAAWFAEWLEEAGYEGLRRSKVTRRGSVKVAGDDIGVGLFWRRGALRLVRSEEVSLAREMHDCSADPALRALVSNHYNQVAVLAELQHLESAQSYAVATTHLSADWRRPWLQLLQAKLLLDRLETFADGLPVVLGGDFNSTPDSGVVRFFLDGVLDEEHPHLQTAAADGVTLPFEDIEHSLMLTHAVQRVLGDSHTSTYTAGFQGCLDHIFVSRSCRLLAALSGLSDATLAEEVGMPSRRFPSDHLPVGVVVRSVLNRTPRARASPRASPRAFSFASIREDPV